MMQCGLRGEVARVSDHGFEYVYAKDVGRAVDVAATIPLPKETCFNIGSGEVLTFDDRGPLGKSSRNKWRYCDHRPEFR